MTNLIITIFAVIIVALMLTGTLIFLNGGAVSTLADAQRIEARLNTGSEAIALYAQANGARPTSPGQIFDGGAPGAIKAAPGAGPNDLGDASLQGGETCGLACGANATCEPATLCVSMPYTEHNRKVAQIVADKMGGTPSGACGGNQTMSDTGRAVVGITF